MPKKYSLSTFADFPIPSYKQRAYRAVLFLDYISEQTVEKVFVISPEPNEEFRNKKVKIFTDYFSASDFKKNQYKVFYRIWSMFRICVKLIKQRLFTSNDIDVIRVSNAYLIFLACITKNKKTILVADCCDFYFDLYREFNMPLANLICPIIFLLEKTALKRANLLFVDTSVQRKFIATEMDLNHERCIVAPNGVLLKNFPYLPKKEPTVMQEYGFSSSDKILFYGGDISEMDGIELLLQFIKEYKNVYKNIKLLIIGKGNETYLNTLKQKIISDQIVDYVIIDTFKPYADYHKYISVADICLAPFKITPTSNAVECGKIITYILMAKPVLSTNAEGVYSLYKNSIQYFRDNDFNDFSEKLKCLIENTITEEQKLELRKLGESFDFEKIIKYEYKIIDEYFKNPHQDFSKYDYH